LTTLDRTTKLIGNVVSPEMALEAGRFGIQLRRRVWKRGAGGASGWPQKIAARGPIRRVLQGLYNRLFWILSGQTGEWVEMDHGEKGPKE